MFHTMADNGTARITTGHSMQWMIEQSQRDGMAIGEGWRENPCTSQRPIQTGAQTMNEHPQTPTAISRPA